MAASAGGAAGAGGGAGGAGGAGGLIADDIAFGASWNPCNMTWCANSCYVDSVLQCLAALPAFVHLLRQPIIAAPRAGDDYMARLDIAQRAICTELRAVLDALVANANRSAGRRRGSATALRKLLAARAGISEYYRLRGDDRFWRSEAGEEQGADAPIHTLIALRSAVAAVYGSAATSGALSDDIEAVPRTGLPAHFYVHEAERVAHVRVVHGREYRLTAVVHVPKSEHFVALVRSPYTPRSAADTLGSARKRKRAATIPPWTLLDDMSTNSHGTSMSAASFNSQPAKHLVCYYSALDLSGREALPVEPSADAATVSHGGYRVGTARAVIHDDLVARGATPKDVRDSLDGIDGRIPRADIGMWRETLAGILKVAPSGSMSESVGGAGGAAGGGSGSDEVIDVDDSDEEDIEYAGAGAGRSVARAYDAPRRGPSLRHSSRVDKSDTLVVHVQKRERALRAAARR